MTYFELVRPPHTFAKEKDYIFFGGLISNNIFEGLGIEMEFDKPSTNDRDGFREKLAEIILSLNSNHFKVERDASLVAGIEVITHPHTIEAMRDFFSGELESLLDRVSDIGVEDFAYTAGTHFHVSKTIFGETTEEQKEAIAKLWYFYSTNKELMMKIGHRTREKQCMCPEDLTTSAAARAKVDLEFDTKARRIKFSKFQAINLRHQDTVEFRMFQGTTDFSLLCFWLEWVWHISNRAKSISWNDAAKIDSWVDGSPQVVKKYIKKYMKGS